MSVGDIFTRSFDLPGRSDPEARHTDEDLAAARAEGYAEGHAAALATAQESEATRQTELVSALLERANELSEQDSARSEAIARDCLDILRSICARLFPQLSACNALDEVLAVVRECLAALEDEPRIVVRVGNEMAEPLEAKLAAVTTQSGYLGKLVLIPDDTLAPTDCAVLWADGGAERNLEKTWLAIEAAMSRVLDDWKVSTFPTEQPSAA